MVLTETSENGTWADYFFSWPRVSGGMKRKEMSVNKAKLGNKLTCSNCGAKFYDLKKKQPVCPKCGEDYVVQKPKTRRAPSPAERIPAPAASPDTTEETGDEDGLIAAELEDELLEDGDEGEDDSVIEDTSDIGGDEDDIGEVIGSVEGSGTESD